VRAAALEEIQGLVERMCVGVGARKARQRLDEKVTLPQAVGTAAQMRRGLLKSRPRRDAVVRFEGHLAERAERDPAERVAVHEVGLLQRLERLETPNAGALEISLAPQEVAEVAGDARRLVPRPEPLDRDRLLEAPPRLHGPTGLELGPAEPEPAPSVLVVGRDRRLVQRDRLAPAPRIAERSGGEVRAEGIVRCELGGAAGLRDGLVGLSLPPCRVRQPDPRTPASGSAAMARSA
jgi:hypothetical protein